MSLTSNISDIDIMEMVRVFTYLDPKPEIAMRLDRWGVRHYPHQKAHCMEWFTSQAQGHRIGRGEVREVETNQSGRLCYNRLKNTGMLVWISSVFGVDESLIEKAVTATAPYQKRTELQASSIAFRKVIPFDTIIEGYNNPSKWKYDPAMKDYLVFDDAGNVDESKSDMFHIIKMMDREYYS